VDRGRFIGIRSLGDWLQLVDSIGELKRIGAGVDPDLEMGTITYLAGKTPGGPALLFENIKGYPGRRLLFNPFGSSLNRLALAIREQPGTDAIQLTRGEMAAYATRAREIGINYIGACCGTVAHHIRAMAEALGRTVPASAKSPDLSKHPIVQQRRTLDELAGKKNPGAGRAW